MDIIVPTLHDSLLSDVDSPIHTVTMEQATQLFHFFKQHALFNWKNSHNGCEGKADAICVLLDAWQIPSAKAWAFSGAYLKNHIGALKKNWNYHVAPALPVMVNEQVIYFVLDPATADTLQTVEVWAASITELPHSYHFVRQAHWYIFPSKNISSTKWHSRNRQNRKWMIQCLAGINGLNTIGKAKLSFNKTRLKRILSSFEQTKKLKPSFTE